MNDAMDGDPVMVNFTPDKLRRLKIEYRKALEGGLGRDEFFEFEGHTYVVGYAKYLIEYLEMRFGKRKD